MPYIDLVFHNIASRIAIVTATPAAYLGFPATTNVYQSAAGAGGAGPFPAYGVAPASAGWGASVTTAAGPAAIFLCECPPYPQFNPAWAPPALPAGHQAAGLMPLPGVVLNKLVAPFDGPAPFAMPMVPGPHLANQLPGAAWFGGMGGIRHLGTGRIDVNGGGVLDLAVPGSDRYATAFQAAWTYPDFSAIRGLFVHTKNTGADPGTQVVALCRALPDHIVFGDLNVDVSWPLKLTSLAAAVGATHQVLLVRQPGGAPYATRQAGASTLDCALIPHAHVGDVELRARRPAAPAVLAANGSDHAVMHLRIRCV